MFTAFVLNTNKSTQTVEYFEDIWALLKVIPNVTVKDFEAFTEDKKDLATGSLILHSYEETD